MDLLLSEGHLKKSGHVNPHGIVTEIGSSLFEFHVHVLLFPHAQFKNGPMFCTTSCFLLRHYLA